MSMALVSRFRGLVRRAPFVVLGLALACAVAPGCSKKKPAPMVDQSGGTGLTEGSLEGDAGGAGGRGSGGSQGSGSSMDQFRAGTLGAAADQGPLKDVHFGYDSYELGDSARELLRINGDWLRDNPASRIEIEGHTDSRGTGEYNLALGAKRATAVRDYLASLGVAADRISTISYGKELPICKDEDDACWAQNRRAHFVILN